MSERNTCNRFAHRLPEPTGPMSERNTCNHFAHRLGGVCSEDVAEEPAGVARLQ
jgi:hypothetical protein